MVQTTLKSKPVSKKRPKPDSDDEDDEHPSDLDSLDATGLSNTPPSSKKQKKAPTATKADSDIENDSMMSGPSKKAPTKKKSATEQYQKLTQLEHIIKRPDTYIGSVERTQESMWVFNSETSQMEMRKVSFVPGLYKIFDEILVNAADNKQRDPTMKVIKVVVDREKGEISVENDGRGIPVEIHKVSHSAIS
jgi:DNA topoisomerase-2